MAIDILVFKDFKQNVWLWLADILPSANHNSSFVLKSFSEMFQG